MTDALIISYRFLFEEYLHLFFKNSNRAQLSKLMLAKFTLFLQIETNQNFDLLTFKNKINCLIEETILLK